MSGCQFRSRGHSFQGILMKLGTSIRRNREFILSSDVCLSGSLYVCKSGLEATDFKQFR